MLREALAMSEVVIAVENLSKRYLIKHALGGQGRNRYTALRDVAINELRNFALRVIDVGRRRRLPRTSEIEEFWALKDVNLQVKQGEILGIIGRNGAGKSTLLKILSRITEPTEGRVRLRGRVGSLLEIGTGFHPELTGRENIFLNGAILGMSRQDISKKFDEIVAFAEVERFLEVPLKRYSSGMYVRLAFAVAAHLEPDILIVDEVLAVGDREFQQKCLGKMREVSHGEGRTVLFVSHNLAIVEKLCPKSIWLEQGSIRQSGSTDAVIREYLSQGSLNLDRFVSLDKLPRPYFGGDHLRLISFEWLSDLPLKHGELVKGRIVFETRAPAAHPVVWFSICDLGGRQILHYDTDLLEACRRTLPQAGSYAVEFEIDALPLGPDTYSLDVCCCNRSTGQFDFVPGALQFELLPGSATPEFLCSEHWQCVHLKNNWVWRCENSEPVLSYS